MTIRGRHGVHRSRGYTAVEVLVAMTLFAIGAAGVIGMLKVTVQGTQDARRMDIATHLAHTWTARLERDSTFWTQPNREFPNVHNLAQTRWLNDVNNAACNANYCNPTFAPADAASAAGSGWAFDYLGRDRWNGSGDHEYCMQYQLNWISPIGAANPLNQDAIMRAEIRIYYARLEGRQVTDCAAPTVSPNDALQAPRTYHFVHAATSIRENVR
jgi:prepilin-type N-terminal cleavage/methylation domain-containing protein